MTSTVGAAFDKALQQMASVKGRLNIFEAVRDTQRDPVLTELERILQGRVGRAFSDERKSALIAEGLKRFENRTPPGYMDAEKQGLPEQGTGDYLLWEQLIARASYVKRDVLLVTRDSKEDWWRFDRNRHQLGPRIELIDEMRLRADVSLLMLRPDELLRASVRLLNAPVSNSTIEDASRLSNTPEEMLDADWSAEAVAELLSRLDVAGATVQSAVIREAAQSSDAFISRELVYDIGDYDENRQLKGFTRPIRGVISGLISDRLLPQNAPFPLTPVYGGDGRALGFRVPDSVVDALSQAPDASGGL